MSEALVERLNAAEIALRDDRPYAAVAIGEASDRIEADAATIASLRDANKALTAERDEARGLVTEANNSLYGSQGYFHSLNGGPYDKYHLASRIENLKSSCRTAERKVAELEAERDNAIAMLETQAKLHRRAEAREARLSEALRNVRRAIMEADPAVLTDTFWMPDSVYRGGTVVDFIDAALSGSGSGWRAMGSAPKDGTAFLAFNSRHMAHPPVVVVWDDDRASWRIEATHHEGAQHINANYFDLWRPLPASPQQGGE